MKIEQMKKASPFILVFLAVISSICANVFFDSPGLSIFLFSIFSCLGVMSYQKTKSSYSDKANKTIKIICITCIPVSILCLLTIYFLISW